MESDEKLNDVLVSIENGQRKQAVEQLYESGLDISEIKDGLERFRTTYGYPFKDMYKILEDVLYVWGEVRYKNGVCDEQDCNY